MSVLARITRLHIVAIAATATLTFGWLFTGAYLWPIVALCATDWFVVNLLNRVVDLDEDKANAIVGTHFVDRNRRPILFVGVGVLLLSFVPTALWWLPLVPLRLAYHALGFAYNWPVLPGRRRIKTLYFWKNTASALGFMITVFAYPLAATGWDAGVFPAGIGVTTVAVTALFFFLFELSYEVIYDLRDAPGDALAGVRTYPVVHGQRGAVRIIDGLVAASIALIVAGFVAGVVPWRIACMGVAPVMQIVLYKRMVRRGITSADCVRITWLGAALLVVYNLWVVAGLPGVGL